jgi:hypothetical protein
MKSMVWGYKNTPFLNKKKAATFVAAFVYSEALLSELKA